ncbi:MAG: GH3 auxin-responsive promoter family protein [Phycisphaerales bacterium]|nr:GH3 auxin-responsive promoter family protein [Phycisphaerales bacterium]
MSKPKTKSVPAPPPNAGHSWTTLVGAAIHARVAVRRKKLADRNWWKENTWRAQVDQLRGLIVSAKGTRFGRAHDFVTLAKITDPAELVRAYQSSVPVADWYAFADDIAAMRDEGQSDILWAGRVDRFAQTSGTTAGDKYIPVSDEMMKANYRASLDIFAHLLNRGVPPERYMGGRCLFLGGSTELDINEHGIATGDLSGLVTPLIRWPISAIYSPGPQIALMDHWPDKIEAMAQLAVDQDIRFISGMPSWALVLIDRVIEIANERGADAKCARDVWPNLEVFVHGGVNFAPFITRMSRAFSGDPNIDFPCRHELYPASEGFIAMQDETDDGSMRLLSDNGTFFEFVPLEQIDDDNPEVFTCWQVEKGRKYVLVMSTNAGLWRYIIGDVVVFDEIPAGPNGGGDGPARLRIVGRHRHFINAFGENIIVEHIEHAVQAAIESTGITTGEFTAAPVYPSQTSRAGLELVVEVESKMSTGDFAKFQSTFDESIKHENVDYTTKRSDDVGMQPPTITQVPIGTFHRWLENKGKLGGQHKCPRCANHRDILAEVLQATQTAGA